MDTIVGSNTERLQRALVSLEGLSVGDAFGGMFFHRFGVEQAEAREVFAPPWDWTDDTLMAFSVVENLREFDTVDADSLVADFVRRFNPGRGYGPTMGMALRALQENPVLDWRDIFPRLFEGQGSYGNGAAMRVGPLGAYFADIDLKDVAEQARQSAETTHTHPEGIAGAIAIAVAAALAWRTRGNTPTRKAFLDAILPYVPNSITSANIRRACDFADGITVALVAPVLGTGLQVSSQDTVPFSLWCAGEWLNDYEEAMWQTVSGMGDRDTTCAIVGSIVAMHVGEKGIPAAWRSAREPLPERIEE